jgi:hypothetical protein
MSPLILGVAFILYILKLLQPFNELRIDPNRNWDEMRRRGWKSVEGCNAPPHTIALFLGTLPQSFRGLSWVNPVFAEERWTRQHIRSHSQSPGCIGCLFPDRYFFLSRK